MKEINTIKVEIMDIKIKISSLLTPSESVVTTDNNEETVTVVADVHAQNDAAHDASVVSIDEDVADVQVDINTEIVGNHLNC